jgi:hypothetical protein
MTADSYHTDHRKISFTIIHAIISLYTVLAIELMLHWNKIVDVYTIRSVGQLIPFVIGLVGFLKLFFELKYREKIRTSLQKVGSGAKRWWKYITHHSQKSNSPGQTDVKLQNRHE